MTKQPTKIIIFNGPAHSGKDTAAGFCVKHFDAMHMKLSAPLKRGLLLLNREHEQAYYEGKKDEAILFGKTYREFQIAAFNMLSSLYGDDILGRLLVEQLATPRARSLVVLSDCGRQAELDPILSAYTPRNVYLVRLGRPGYDFANDIRGYVKHPYGSNEVEIDNRHDLEVFEMQVCRAVEAWLHQGKAPR